MIPTLTREARRFAILLASDMLRGSFTLSVITNESESSREVVVRRREAGGAEVTESPLGLAWPLGLYSLSHIALPFPPDDPVYGGMDTVNHS